MISRIKGVSILEKDYWFPRARKLIELALPMIASGKALTAEEIKPIYLYPQECQIKKDRLPAHLGRGQPGQFGV